MEINQTIINQWKAEEQKEFQGWDFSHLDGRWESEALPWDYRNLILTYRKMTDHLLDMGTGGGEFLLTLNHPPRLTSVTESFPPNIEICLGTLSPTGICVKQSYDRQPIPYENDSFDLVLNRHEDFEAREIFRILKPGGMFITQQVGGTNNADLSRRLIPDYKPQFPEHTLQNNIAVLQAAGLQIILAQEFFPKLRFYDTGELVYFAKIIEWEFPNFSVQACKHTLIQIHQEIESNGYVESTEHRFVIVAVKPDTQA